MAASEGKPINVVDRFVIWEGGIGERLLNIKGVESWPNPRTHP
jgi:hypothetical protein